MASERLVPIAICPAQGSFLHPHLISALSSSGVYNWQGLKTDVYVAGLKKVTWYDDKPWSGTRQGRRSGDVTG